MCYPLQFWSYLQILAIFYNIFYKTHHQNYIIANHENNSNTCFLFFFLTQSIIRNNCSTIQGNIDKTHFTTPSIQHPHTCTLIIQSLSSFLFWHLEQVYLERQISCISLCAVLQCSVCNLRGVSISIVNQTKQSLCQWCKHRELNLLQFTTRSSSANLTAQEIKSPLNYSICFLCRTMRADIIYNWRFSRL